MRQALRGLMALALVACDETAAGIDASCMEPPPPDDGGAEDSGEGMDAARRDGSVVPREDEDPLIMMRDDEPAMRPPILAPTVDSMVAMAVSDWFAPSGDDPAAVAMVIGIYDNGTEHRYFYGETAQGNGIRPTARTMFQIGSVTKVFTGTLLALLDYRGIVSLDDPLASHVPSAAGTVPASRDYMTLVMLATHSSGLDRNACDEVSTSPYTVQSMWDALFQCPLTAEGRGYYQYSNLGIALLGHALGHALDGATGVDPTGIAWRVAVQADIVGPLHMGDTRLLEQLSNDQEARQAIGYTGADSHEAALSSERLPAFNPAGGLVSDLDDMMLWLRFNLGHNTTPEAAELNAVLPTVMLNRPTADRDMALGWEISEVDGDGTPRLTWKGGATPGFVAYVGLVDDDDTGVVVLANFSAVSVSTIGKQILASLYRRP